MGVLNIISHYYAVKDERIRFNKKKLTFQLILSYGNSDSRECGIVTEKKKIMELGTQLVGMYNTSLCMCVVCK